MAAASAVFRAVATFQHVIGIGFDSDRMWLERWFHLKRKTSIPDIPLGVGAEVALVLLAPRSENRS